METARPRTTSRRRPSAFDVLPESITPLQARITSPILGIEFFVGDLDRAADVIVHRALAKQGGYACFTGVHGTVLSQHDRHLQRALRGAWCNFPDGAPIAWLSRQLGWDDAQRIPGPDLMPAVLRRGAKFGLRHYFFGSTDAVLGEVERHALAVAPNIEIAGSWSPPFTDTAVPEDADVLNRLRRAEPHIVWVGLGSPKQDLWMDANARRLAPALTIGVGAAFDFLAQRIPRAPLWMQRIGLEWLHRAVTEPRLRRRYLRVNSEFVALAIGTLLKQQTKGSPSAEAG